MKTQSFQKLNILEKHKTMTIKRHLIHVKSNTPNKIPLSEDIKHGEIAINYANGNEKIYLRNENDVIQSIQTDL